MSAIPSFKRRNVLLPFAVAVLLVPCIYLFSEARRSTAIEFSTAIREGLERVRRVDVVSATTAEVESGQFGYLLTHDDTYRQLYESSRLRLQGSILELQNAYKGNMPESSAISRVVSLLNARLAEAAFTVESLQQTGRSQDSMNVVKEGAGLLRMRDVRADLDAIRSRERQVVDAQIGAWEQLHRTSRNLSLGGSLVSMLLLLLGGFLVMRNMERRSVANTELDREVTQRTRELSELSAYLQRVTELERSRLARELHDELGGLLVAIKMDLQQLTKHVDIEDPRILPRWQRIQQAIRDGVDLKRRVIEELRPTLLDNLGLAAALRWQAEQTCNQAGIKLLADLPDDELSLSGDVSIAMFRVAQEALVNVVKHSGAKVVRVSLEVQPGSLTLAVEDDGIGVAPSAGRLGGHGLTGMRHRIRTLHGSFRVEPAKPQGTRIVAEVPIDAMPPAQEQPR